MKASNMRRSATFLALCLLSMAAPADDRRGPIVPLSLTNEELQEFVADLIADGIAEADARSLAASGVTTYRDSDIRRLFPEITPTDRQVYACSAGVNPRRYSFGYLSDVQDDHLVTVKKLDCDWTGVGLYCELEALDAVFDVHEEQFFALSVDIDVAEGLRVFRSYWRDIRPTLDAISQELEVDAIEKEHGRYKLHLGRDGCACSGRVTLAPVRLFGWLFRVRLDGRPEVQCA